MGKQNIVLSRDNGDTKIGRLNGEKDGREG